METKTVDHNLEYDGKLARLRKRYQGLSRVAAAINDLSIYGVFSSNYPNLTIVLEQAKDHCKNIIKETKAEIAFIEDPQSNYDLTNNEVLPDADEEAAKEIKKMRDEGLI
jgi:Cys-tRNA synthase (O-phospho-L-seryl-tRNA:Cys-tRNA synthase)